MAAQAHDTPGRKGRKHRNQLHRGASGQRLGLPPRPCLAYKSTPRRASSSRRPDTPILVPDKQPTCQEKGNTLVKIRGIPRPQRLGKNRNSRLADGGGSGRGSAANATSIARKHSRPSHAAPRPRRFTNPALSHRYMTTTRNLPSGQRTGAGDRTSVSHPCAPSPSGGPETVPPGTGPGTRTGCCKP